MAQGDAIISSNIVVGTFFEQPGTQFTESLDGWDSGTKTWVTHRDTPRDTPNFPRIGDKDSSLDYMFIQTVDVSSEESGLRVITASYRGAINTDGFGVQKQPYDVPGVNTQMVTLPALTGGGDSQKKSLIVPVPMPTLSRNYLTTTIPTFDGVGGPATGDFLPPPGAFSISYLPDTEQPLPANYYYGWVLMSRTWEHTANLVWLVSEEYQWFWGFA